MKPPPPPEPVGELRLWASSDEADEASVSLAFFDTEREPGAPELDPDHVTKLLQAEPTRAMRRGAVLLDPQYHRIARTSSWRLQGPRLSDPPLEQQIRQFLARLPPPGPVWKSYGHARGSCSADYSCISGIASAICRRSCCLRLHGGTSAFGSTSTSSEKSRTSVKTPSNLGAAPTPPNPRMQPTGRMGPELRPGVARRWRTAERRLVRARA